MLECPESLATINRRLKDWYGSDTVTGKAIFRIIWSENETEKRLMNVTDGGISLLVPEWRDVPKYRNYLKDKYVLERLVIVPLVQQNELGSKTSYEPVWVFENNKTREALPVKWEAIEVIMASFYAALGKENDFAKYADPGENPEEAKERVDNIKSELFGNETAVGDALKLGYGVTDFNPKVQFEEKVN